MTFLKKTFFSQKTRFHLSLRLFFTRKIEQFDQLITCVVLQINDTILLFYFHLIDKTL